MNDQEVGVNDEKAWVETRGINDQEVILSQVENEPDMKANMNDL